MGYFSGHLTYLSTTGEFASMNPLAFLRLADATSGRRRRSTLEGNGRGPHGGGAFTTRMSTRRSVTFDGRMRRVGHYRGALRDESVWGRRVSR
jgi:hypothetical protein